MNLINLSIPFDVLLPTYIQGYRSDFRAKEIIEISEDDFPYVIQRQTRMHCRLRGFFIGDLDEMSYIYVYADGIRPLSLFFKEHFPELFYL
jgi:hypothetical protein